MTVAKGLPAGASLLLNFISHTETKKTGAAAYEVIYGHNEDKLKRPITKMTIDQVVAAQPSWTKRFGSSAAGAYQVMRNTLDAPNTLSDIAGEMGLTGDELFDAEMQDLIGYHLLKRRGFAKFMAGKLSTEAFGLNLAKEWASFPVLKRVKGAHRMVNRGQSYYAGDNVNKALVAPERVEAILAKVATAAAPAPKPRRPEPVVDEPDYEEPPVPRPRADRAAARFTDKKTVQRVQALLWDLGYTEVGSRDPETGDFDGRIGTLTKGAIAAFRNENDLPPGDHIDAELLEALATVQPRDLGTDRTDATAKDVGKQVPEVHNSLISRVWAWFLGGGAAALGVGSAAGDADPNPKGTLKQLLGYFLDVPGWFWCAIIVVIALAIVWHNSRAVKSGVEAFQTGARR